METIEELLQEYISLTGLHQFEGERGLDRLDQVCSVLGYNETPFKHGSVLESFLADNPGACDAIVEWIGEQKVSTWRSNLEEEVDAINSEEDEDNQEMANEQAD